MRTAGLRIADNAITLAVVDDGDVAFATCTPETLTAALGELQATTARTGAGFAAPVLTRVFHFPFVQPGKIRQALPLLLDDHVPGNVDAYERLTLVDRDEAGGVACVWLTPRAAVHAARDVMRLSGDPRLMQHEALLVAPPVPAGNHAFVWLTPQTTTVVVRDGQVAKAIFTIPIGRDHLDAGHAAADLRTRLVAGLDRPVAAWLVDGWGRGDSEVAALFDGLDDGVPWQWADLAPDTPSDPAARVAWHAALAVADRRRPLWNLGPPRRLPIVDTLRHPLVRRLAPAAAAVIVLSITAVISGTAAVRARTDAGRRELNAIYERNFPGSRIVDPLRQMRSVTERASGGGSSTTTAPMVARLAEFHRAISAGTGIKLAELRSADSEWMLKGEAPSFGAVDELKRVLETLSWPGDVRVQRAEQTVDKTAIRFQIAFADKGGR